MLLVEKVDFLLDKLPKGVKRNIVLSILVKIRADYTCQICYKKYGPKSQNPVQAHHIDKLSEGGKDHSDNLIVLCFKHHKRLHFANF